jgi:ribose transport system permease protein
MVRALSTVRSRGRSIVASFAHPQAAARGLRRWIGPGWLWALLVVAVVGATLSSPYFFTSANLRNLMGQSVALGIVAIGQTFVILTAGIDISVAASISLSSCLLMGIVNGDPAKIVVAVAVVLVVGIVIGLVNGITIVAARIPPFIVTLATASIVQGVVFLYTDQTTIGKPAPQMSKLGYQAWGPFPVLFVGLVALAAVALIVQNRTVGGRHLFAVGGSEQISRLSGVSTGRVKIAAYVACGFLAALAGIALSMRLGAGEPLVGQGFDWDSIAAVVIGGTLLTGGRGGVGGTIGGVAMIVILNNTMNLLAVSPYLQLVAKGMIVVLAVIISAVSASRAARGATLGWWRDTRAPRGRESVIEGGV